MKIKDFKRKVLDGRSILVVSALFAIAVRIIYFGNMIGNYVPVTEPVHGLFGNGLLDYLNQNLYLSMLSSGLAVFLLAILAHYINSRHLLIRAKTHLPETFVFFFFSLSPTFLSMHIHYLDALVVMLTISALFTAYGSNTKQRSALNTSIIIALFSILDIRLLLYFPMLWLALAIMRSFNFRAFLATLFGLVVVYAPIISYCLFTQQINLFYEPFIVLANIDFLQFPFLRYDPSYWAFILFTILVFTLVFINDYMQSYKDKIRTRACNRLLASVFIFSGLLSLFFNADAVSFEFITLAISPLILGHFYALAEERWKLILFALYTVLCLIVCFIKFEAVL